MESQSLAKGPIENQSLRCSCCIRVELLIKEARDLEKPNIILRTSLIRSHLSDLFPMSSKVEIKSDEHPGQNQKQTQRRG